MAYLVPGFFAADRRRAEPPGTLAEMTFTWQKLWLKMLPQRPFVLLGKAWRPVLDCWLENLIVRPDDYDCMKIADTPYQYQRVSVKNMAIGSASISLA